MRVAIHEDVVEPSPRALEDPVPDGGRALEPVSVLALNPLRPVFGWNAISLVNNIDVGRGNLDAPIVHINSLRCNRTNVHDEYSEPREKREQGFREMHRVPVERRRGAMRSRGELW